MREKLKVSTPVIMKSEALTPPPGVRQRACAGRNRESELGTRSRRAVAAPADRGCGTRYMNLVPLVTASAGGLEGEEAVGDAGGDGGMGRAAGGRVVAADFDDGRAHAAVFGDGRSDGNRRRAKRRPEHRRER